MNNSNKSYNDWDQFVIIDQELNTVHDKVHPFNQVFKKINIQDTIKENTSEDKIMKVSSNFSINDTLNNKSNCYSYLDLLVNTSAGLIKKVLFSLCYISIKYIYTI